MKVKGIIHKINQAIQTMTLESGTKTKDNLGVKFKGQVHLQIFTLTWLSV